MATINQGRVEYSFHHAAGEVVQLVLERIGHIVVTTAAEEQAIFTKQQAGDVDILMGWLENSHGDYLDKYRQDAVVLENAIYSPHCIWGVPDYVPAVQVKSVVDLLKPNVAAKMQKVIRAVNPGADVSKVSMEMIEKYKLDKAGYSFNNTPKSSNVDDFEAAYQNNEWFITPLWHPHQLHIKYKIRPLEDPLGILPEADKAQLIILKSSLPKFSEGDALSILRRITIGNEALSLMDSYIWRDGMSPRLAALRWMRDNEPRVETWFNKTPYERLRDLGLELPEPPAAVSNYVRFGVTRDGFIETSLQLPWVNKQLPWKGKISTRAAGEGTISVEDGYKATRATAMNVLAQLHDASGGDLSRVKMVRLEGHVLLDEDFTESPKLLDQASDIFTNVLGENGIHARMLLHYSSAPLDAPVLLGAHAELLW
ncbi:hypothetical protein V8C40DRAFT_273431 [Trichoderma camerunense]